MFDQVGKKREAEKILYTTTKKSISSSIIKSCCHIGLTVERKIMDNSRELQNARVSLAIRNIREGIKLMKKYGLTLTEKEKAIIIGK